MKPRISVDTSVVRGCEDPEFRDPSRRLLEAFSAGRASVVISELTLGELAQAQELVRQVLTRVPMGNTETLALSAEADKLAQEYLAEQVVGPQMAVDALHIARATVARVDVLVSWNFKHSVNLRRIHGFNAVNLKCGYPLLEIRSPLEVFADE